MYLRTGSASRLHSPPFSRQIVVSFSQFARRYWILSYPVWMRASSSFVGGPFAARAGNGAAATRARAAPATKSRREAAAAAWTAVVEGGRRDGGGLTWEEVNAEAPAAMAARSRMLELTMARGVPSLTE